MLAGQRRGGKCERVLQGMTGRQGGKKKIPPCFRKEACIMALKTEWQRRQEAAGKREFKRWDWIHGYKERRIQYRKALYMEGYKVNYPFRKK